jgi:hypothetical protein
MLFLHTRLPFEYAQSLEQMGTEGELTRAEETLEALEKQMELLVTALSEAVHAKEPRKR